MSGISSVCWRHSRTLLYVATVTSSPVPLAERARRELLSTGEAVRKLAMETRSELTAQETAIARLAREGLTNTEIGAQLFLSARAVEWHLGSVFTKLGIRSRRELRRPLAPFPQTDPSR